MAEEKAEVHRRIAVMGRFIVHESEAFFVNQNVFRTIVAMAKRLMGGHHSGDNSLNRASDFRPAFLNALVKRLYAQLHENGAIADLVHHVRVPGSPFMDL